MMESIPEFCKLSKELVKEFLELCSSLEKDSFSDNFTEESKKEKLMKMNKKVQKLSASLKTAEKIHIRANDTKHINNETKKNKITRVLSDSQVKVVLSDIAVQYLSKDVFDDEQINNILTDVDKSNIITKLSVLNDSEDDTIARSKANNSYKDIISEATKDNSMSNVLNCDNARNHEAADSILVMVDSESESDIDTVVIDDCCVVLNKSDTLNTNNTKFGNSDIAIIDHGASANSNALNELSNDSGEINHSSKNNMTIKYPASDHKETSTEEVVTRDNRNMSPEFNADRYADTTSESSVRLENTDIVNDVDLDEQSIQEDKNLNNDENSVISIGGRITDELIYNIKDCFVILEDISESDKKHFQDKAFFKNLEKEINKLSKIPTFHDIVSRREKKVKEKKDIQTKTNVRRALQSDSDDGDDDSESDIVSVHEDDIDIMNTVMIDDVIESSSDGESSVDSSEDEVKPASSVASNHKQVQNKRPITRSTKRLVIPDSDSDNEKSKKKPKLEEPSKKVVCLSSSSDESNSKSTYAESVNDSNKRKKCGQQNNVKKMKIDDENEEADGDVVTRKNLHKIFSTDKLSKETLNAEQLEIERRKRMEEKQRIYNKSMLNKQLSTGDDVSSLILEKDPNGKSIVEVHKHIAKKLKVHQIEAIQFMYDCVIESVSCLQESQNENAKDVKSSSIGGCILAHCMGLGKTLSLIAFVHTMLTTPILNMDSCIVVCPVNTALNWKKELKIWLPSDRPLKVFEVCSNSTKKDKVSIIQQWHKKGGVLIIGYEMYRNLATGDTKTIKSKIVREKMVEALVNPGADIIVCDEGHLLKNEKTAISKVINTVKTMRRIVLTGTPLQNKLLEYHTMVNFVKPNLLGTRKEFQNRFANPIANGQCSDSTPYDVKIMQKRAHILYKTLDGCVHRRDYSALVKYLPPKYEYIIKIRMSDIQIQLYRAYLNVIGKRNLFENERCLARIWTHPFVVCMHQEIQNKKVILDDSEGESFIDDASDNELQKRKSKKPLTEINTVNIDTEDSGDDVRKNDVVDSESGLEEIVKDWGTSTRNKGCCKGGEEVTDPVNSNIDTNWFSDIIQPEHEHQIEISGKLMILIQILRKASDIGDKVIVFSHSLLVLNIIEKYLGELHKIAQDYKKNLKEINKSMSDENIPMLNHDEIKYSEFYNPLGLNTWSKGLDYDRMDGSTQLGTRADIQARFNSERDKRLRLFLISTKAGGIGVNLVAANRVVIFDVSWNPSHDIQAIFRSYRFGQVKPVYVYRLVSQGTMEERMYERQVTKQSLSLRVVDEHQISRYFTEEEMRSLYKFEPDVYDPQKERETPILPKDLFLADLIQEFPQWIYCYHEHDSLFENKNDEELTESERQEAWKEFEDEKVRGLRPAYNPGNMSFNNLTSVPAQLNFDYNQFARTLMALIKSHRPQYAALFARNYVNLLRFALAQQPELKINPAQLSIRMQALFYQSVEKFRVDQPGVIEELDAKWKNRRVLDGDGDDDVQIIE